MSQGRSILLWKRILSTILITTLVMTATITPSYGARINQEFISFNPHTQQLEIKFTMQYKQYINIAVYTNNNNQPGDLIGYIAKNYFANGKEEYVPHNYYICPKNDHHASGAGLSAEEIAKQTTYRSVPRPSWAKEPTDSPDGAITLSSIFTQEFSVEERPLEEETPVSEAVKEERTEDKDLLEDEKSAEVEKNEKEEPEQEKEENTEENIEESTVEKEEFSQTEEFTSSPEEVQQDALLSPLMKSKEGSRRQGILPLLGTLTQGMQEDATETQSKTAFEQEGREEEERENGSQEELSNSTAENKEITETEKVAEQKSEEQKEVQGKTENKEDTHEDAAVPEPTVPFRMQTVEEPLSAEDLYKIQHQVEINSIRVVDKEDQRSIGKMPPNREEGNAYAVEGGISLFSDPPEAEKNKLVIDGDPSVDGGTILYWNGRVDRSLDHNSTTTGWYPVLDNPKENWRGVIIVIEPIGFPWKNVQQSCQTVPDGFGGTTIVHNRGENWEWSSLFPAKAGLFYLDGNTWFLGPLNELTPCINLFLEMYYNGDITLEELMLFVEEGDPVDMITGNYSFEYNDLELHGQWPLQFKRIYSAQDTNDSAGLGKGFSHLYDFHLKEEAGIIYVEGPFGELIPFFRVFDKALGRDIYQPLRGGSFSLKSSDRVNYEMTFEDGSVFSFKDGLMQSMKTKGGQTIAKLSYNGKQLSRIENDYGRYFNLTWENGQVKEIKDSAGRTVSYKYAGNLQSSFTNADGDSVFYTYDGNGYMNTLKDFDGNIYLENEYDSEGRVTEQKMHSEGGTAKMGIAYDDSELKASSPSANARGKNTVKTFTGETKIYYYDWEGLIINIEEGDGNNLSNTWGDNYRADSISRKGQAEISYSDYTQEEQPGTVTYQDGAVLKVDYEGNRVTKITYNDDNQTTETFTYDTGGNLMVYKDRNGHTTKYTYSNGLLTSMTDAENTTPAPTTKYIYTGDLLTELQESEGKVTKWEYDSAGRIKQETGPLGEVKKFEYSEAGKLMKEIRSPDATGMQGLDGQRSYTYSKNGMITSVTDFNGNTETIVMGKMNLPISHTDRAGNVMTYEYTPFGAKQSETDFAGNTTTYDYDEKGRLTTVIDASGNVSKYDYDKLNRLSSILDAKGKKESYTYDFMGRLATVTDRNGYVTEKTYDFDGRLIKEVQAQGIINEAVSTIYTYDPVGNLTKVTDPKGNSTTYTYTKRNLLETVTDGEGRVTAYAYDKLGRMASEILTPETGVQHTTKYTYDQGDNVTELTDPKGGVQTFAYDKWSRLVSEKTPLGHETTYTYDKNGNLLTRKDPVGTITDPVDAVTEMTYDALDRIASIKDPRDHMTGYIYFGTYGIKEITYPDNYTEKYTYTALGQVETYTDRKGGVTSYTYDARKQVDSTIDGENYLTVYGYDNNQNLITMQRGGVQVLENIIDPLGRIKAQIDPKGTTTYGYDEAGNLTSRTDKNGNKTIYIYDKSNLPIEITDPLGGMTLYTYDGAARQTAVTDPGGLTRSVIYDGNSNPVTMTESDGTTISSWHMIYDKDNRVEEFIDAQGTATKYTYTRAGQVETSLIPHIDESKVIKEEYEYDLAGNLTFVKDPLRGRSLYAYDFAGNLRSHQNQLDHMTFYTYDPNHNLESVTDPKDNITSYQYDYLNRLVEEKKAAGETITYVYDAFSNITAAKQRQANGESLTQFEKDPLGNPIKEISALGAVHRFETDGEGNLTKETDPDGNTNTYLYDELNRIKAANIQGQGPTVYTYDAMGNVVRTEEDLGNTELTYDKWNRLTAVKDHQGNKVSYTYDLMGNKTGMIYPDDSKVAYKYDHISRLEEIKYQEEVKTYRYDMKSQLVEETYPAIEGTRHPITGEPLQEKTSYSYNNAGYLTEGKEMTPGGQTRRQTTYAHQDNGWLGSETRIGVDVGEKEESLSYRYDASGKLLWTKKDGVVTDYTYDIAGNLIKEVGGGKETSYTYDRQNRMTEKVTDGKRYQYTYDGRGNLIKETTPEGSSTYGYDGKGRLISGTNVKGEESRYGYNSLGARVFHEEVRDNTNNGHQNGPYVKGSFETSSTLERILHEGRADWQRIWETAVAKTVVQNDRETVTKHYLPDYTSVANRDIFVTEDGSFTQNYIYDDGMTLNPVLLKLGYAHETQRNGANPGENPGSDIVNSITKKVWYRGNHLLSSNVIGTDNKGEVKFHMIYDEWGVPQIDTRLDMNLHGLDNINNFTGYSYDEVLEIYYAQARFYDPQTRRFIQEDPIKDGQNWYAYCGSNPVTNLDPLGFWTLAVGWQGAVALGLRLSLGEMLVIDGEGNLGKVEVYAAGGGTPTVSVDISGYWTNAKNISQLEGFGASAGGSISYFTGSFLASNSDGTPITGGSGGIGVGIPEMHGDLSYSNIKYYNWIGTREQRLKIIQTYFDHLSCAQQQYLKDKLGVDLETKYETTIKNSGRSSGGRHGKK